MNAFFFPHVNVLLCGKTVGRYHPTYNHIYHQDYKFCIHDLFKFGLETSSQCLRHHATQPFATFPFILLTMQQLNPKIDKSFFKFVRMKKLKT